MRLMEGVVKMADKNKYDHAVSGRGRKMIDVTGRIFGRLTALYPTKKRDCKGSILWHCRCSCGNEKDISVEALITGNYVSCGCRKRELNMQVSSNLHFIDGTCVEWLRSRKSRNDNTSGFRGVNQRKDGKFVANIGFKGKRYYIGTYMTFEEAVTARLDVEEEIHGGFLKAYEAWKARADRDQSWRDAHPFYYEIRKVGGHFVTDTVAYV